MLNNSEFRKHLIVSLITSILVLIFIEPFLKWLANGLMWLGLNISESFTKSVYTSAALGFREKHSFLALMLITSVLAGMMAGMASIKIWPSWAPNPKQKSATSRKIFSAFFAVAFLGLSFYIMAGNFIELQLNTSFNQRITVLSSKLPDQRIKELKADWALMKNRSDYEALTIQMDDLAKAHGIALPPALWE